MNKYSNEVPVVMASDHNYLLPSCVTVWSVLKNGSQDTKYEFYFLVSVELENMDNGLFDIFKDVFPNFSYQYIIIDKHLFDSVTLTNQHVTIETYYRLIVSELLPSIDKCIYLDGDTIIQCDIAELYQIDLKMDFYLAAVVDIGMQCGRGEYFAKHKRELGFESMETYFNAGVLVFNLKKIRSDKCVPDFLKTIDKNYSLEDQDILNVVCKGKVHFLPLRYNVFSGFLRKEEFYNCGMFGKEEMREIREGNICIMHYAGGVEKPWINQYGKDAELWWRYAIEIPVIKWVEDKRDEWLFPKRECDWTNLVNRCQKYDIVFIYGYTWISRNLLQRLQKSGVKNIKFFFDNDKKKIGQIYENVKCIEVKEWIVFLRCRYLIINCAQKAFKDIRRTLCNIGVPEDNVVDYALKDRNYFKILDERYFDSELEKEVFSDTSLQIKYPGLYQDTLEKKKQILASHENYCLYPEVYSRYFLFDWYVNKPLISIIIPAYNAEKYIDRCLKSIYEQTYSQWECIVINDGSTDRTDEHITLWAQRDNRIRLISQINKGMGQARNRGISLATGKYLTFVDSDDWIEPDYVEEMLMAALKNNAEICKCNFLYHDLQNNKVFPAGIGEKIDPYTVEVYRTPNMWCNLFAKKLFEDNKIKMPEIPLEDLAIYPLLLLRAKGIIGVAKPLYHYQINTGDSVMDRIENIMYYPEAISYLLKECERLDLKDKYQDLLRDISWHHMNGSLNGRVQKHLSQDKVEECRKRWYEFMEGCFPGCLKHYNVKINR